MKKRYFGLLCALVLLGTQAKSQVVYFNNFENWTGSTPVNYIGTQTTLEADSILSYSVSAHTGSKSCRLINEENTIKKVSTTPFSLQLGATYSISYWVRGSGSIIGASIYTGTSTILTGINGTIDTLTWVYRTINFIANATSTTAELVFTLRQTKSDIDDLQIDDILIYKTEPFQNLDTNNISARVSSNGSLFNGHFEAPNGSGLQTIYENNVWIGGKDINNQLHLAAQTYSSTGADFSFGPIASNYNDTSFQVKYNKVWKISKKEIDQHIANYSNVGYIIPSIISNWPGNGNVSNGEMATLAPYMDVNTNNKYDPENGDYPLIRGDQAVFFMFNDDKIAHATSGEKLKIEVHGMAYTFVNASDSALSQTVFVNYDIFNRSTYNYHDLYFGSFTDMDLGYSTDDFVGCDSLLNLFYTYNATNSDGTGATGQYGTPAPAQGAMFLNHPISRFLYFNNGTAGSPTTEPINAQGYYNFLLGLWNDGTPMTYGGTGYGGTTATNFMFSGVPETSTDWTEISAGNVASDRRGVMSVGPFNVNAGEKFCVDLAFPFARDYSGTNLTSLALLRQRAQSIQTYYNIQGYVCSMPSGISQPNLNTDLIQVYPNPSNGKINVVVPNFTSNSKIEIFSIIGKMIYSTKIISNNTLIDLESNKGLFIYKVTNINGTVVGKGKLIIE